MKFQMFYDYGCPYCKLGFQTLLDLLPNYPAAEIEWVPIEVHPRPEEGDSPHTDLCVQAFYIASELGADLLAFHKALYQAVAVEGQNVEKEEVLAKILEGIVDSGKLLEILKSGKYAARVNENNDLAYEKNEVWIVPAFRIPGGDSSIRADAKAEIGISKEELKSFLDKC